MSKELSRGATIFRMAFTPEDVNGMAIEVADRIMNNYFKQVHLDPDRPDMNEEELKLEIMSEMIPEIEKGIQDYWENCYPEKPRKSNE